MLDQIDELEAENETLQDQVDSIAEIIEPAEDADEGETLAPACGVGWRKEAHEVTDAGSDNGPPNVGKQIISTAVSTGI